MVEVKFVVATNSEDCDVEGYSINDESTTIQVDPKTFTLLEKYAKRLDQTADDVIAMDILTLFDRLKNHEPPQMSDEILQTLTDVLGIVEDLMLSNHNINRTDTRKLIKKTIEMQETILGLL